MFYSKLTGGFYDTAIHGDAMPADAVEISSELHATLLAGQSAGKRITADVNGFPVLSDPPAPTPAEFQQQREQALQSKLDNYAQSWGYDSIVSAASYAASTNAKFKGEADALIAWRDAVWAWAESLTTLPASIADLIAAMPSAPARPVI